MLPDKLTVTSGEDEETCPSSPQQTPSGFEVPLPVVIEIIENGLPPSPSQPSKLIPVNSESMLPDKLTVTSGEDEETRPSSPPVVMEIIDDRLPSSPSQLMHVNLDIMLPDKLTVTPREDEETSPSSPQQLQQTPCADLKKVPVLTEIIENGFSASPSQVLVLPVNSEIMLPDKLTVTLGEDQENSPPSPQQTSCTGFKVPVVMEIIDNRLPSSPSQLMHVKSDIMLPDKLTVTVGEDKETSPSSPQQTPCTGFNVPIVIEIIESGLPGSPSQLIHENSDIMLAEKLRVNSGEEEKTSPSSPQQTPSGFEVPLPVVIEITENGLPPSPTQLIPGNSEIMLPGKLTVTSGDEETNPPSPQQTPWTGFKVPLPVVIKITENGLPSSPSQLMPVNVKGGSVFQQSVSGEIVDSRSPGPICEGVNLEGTQNDVESWTPALDVFSSGNSNDWDALMSRGTGTATVNRWERNSLYQKFDPLISRRATIMKPKTPTTPINRLAAHDESIDESGAKCSGESFYTAKENQSSLTPTSEVNSISNSPILNESVHGGDEYRMGEPNKVYGNENIFKDLLGEEPHLQITLMESEEVFKLEEAFSALNIVDESLTTDVSLSDINSITSRSKHPSENVDDEQGSKDSEESSHMHETAKVLKDLMSEKKSLEMKLSEEQISNDKIKLQGHNALTDLNIVEESLATTDVSDINSITSLLNNDSVDVDDGKNSEESSYMHENSKVLKDLTSEKKFLEMKLTEEQISSDIIKLQGHLSDLSIVEESLATDVLLSDINSTTSPLKNESVDVDDEEGSKGSEESSYMHEKAKVLKDLMSQKNSLEMELTEEQISNDIIRLQGHNALSELNIVEGSFAEVLLSYEGMKVYQKNFESNQKILKERDIMLTNALARREEKFDYTEKKVNESIEKFKRDQEARLKQVETENMKLRAKMRMAEMKSTKLESEIQQTEVEMNKLRALCDEMIKT